MPTWLGIEQENGKPVVRMRLYLGAIGSYPDARVENDRVMFSIVKKQKQNGNHTRQGSVTHVNGGSQNGQLQGSLVKQINGGETTRANFTGTKIPPMPIEAPREIR